MEAAGLGLTTKMVVSVVLGGVLGLIVYLYGVLVLHPRRLQSKLRRQGIRGPSPSLLIGNIAEMKKIQLQAPPSTATEHHLPLSHDWPSTVFPYIRQWRIKYGTLSLSFILLSVRSFSVSTVVSFLVWF